MAIELPALRLEQGEAVLYQTRVPIDLLVSEGFSKPDAWTPQNKQGYQREPRATRFKKIAEYVLGRGVYESLMPQNIVLNARTPVHFEGSDGGGVSGVLVIPDEALPLWEVDGQHRICGLRLAYGEMSPEDAVYDLPVTIVQQPARLKEAILFWLINTTQVKVPTEIAQRIIHEQAHDPGLLARLQGDKQDYIVHAVDVVDVLNSTPGHPWSGRIGIPSVSGPGIRMRQTSFVQSLKPVIKAAHYMDIGDDATTMASTLMAYWKALEKVFPEAFAEPREHVIQKTVGVFPLHGVLPDVVKVVLRQRRTLDPKGFAHVLGAMDLPDNFWHKHDGEAGKYAGAKGFYILEAMLRDSLPQQRASA